MRYLYLFIFFFFILLNVLIGLASSRSKKRRAAAGQAASKPDGEATAGGQPDAETGAYRRDDSRESVLRPQTADSIMESFFVVEEEKAVLPGGDAERSGVKTTDQAIPDVGPVGQGPVQQGPVERGAESPVLFEQKPEEPKPMIDISSPRQEVTLSIERNLLESEVEARAREKRKAQDAKYASRDQFWYQETETGVWERIYRLSPLKRAILLSEILASPRGLSEGGHSE